MASAAPLRVVPARDRPAAALPPKRAQPAKRARAAALAAIPVAGPGNEALVSVAIPPLTAAPDWTPLAPPPAAFTVPTNIIARPDDMPVLTAVSVGPADLGVAAALPLPAPQAEQPASMAAALEPLAVGNLASPVAEADAVAVPGAQADSAWVTVAPPDDLAPGAWPPPLLADAAYSRVASVHPAIAASAEHGLITEAPPVPGANAERLSADAETSPPALADDTYAGLGTATPPLAQGAALQRLVVMTERAPLLEAAVQAPTMAEPAAAVLSLATVAALGDAAAGLTAAPEAIDLVPAIGAATAAATISTVADATAADATAADAAAAEAQAVARGARPQDNAVLSARLPVVVDGRRFASVPVTATVTEVLTVAPSLLAAALEPILSEDARQRLAALGPGQVAIATLGELGFLVRLDPQTLSVVVDVPAALRAFERFSLINLDQYPEAKQIYPSRLSAGVTGSLSIIDNSDDGIDPAIRAGFTGFANIGGLNGINIDYGGALDFQNGAVDFRRDAIVAFMDRPEQALRYAAGDLFPVLPVLGGSAPILGVSVQRSYQLLQPVRIIRPTGRRSFLLEQPGTVEVYSNGILINRFAAGPGPIDLADIPVANISNNISIVVEDGFGRRELDSFSLANDVNLLGAGLDEFSLSAGVLRDVNEVGFSYLDDWIVAGNYQRGLTERVTAGAHVAATQDFQNLGGSVAFAGFRGVALVEGAGSRSAGGLEGFSASLSYRGGNFLPQGTNDVLTARFEYFSEDFATLSDPQSVGDDRWRLSLDYRFELSERTSVLLGGAYADRHSVAGSDQFVTAGLNHRIGRLQAAVTGRWSRDALGREEVGGFVTLSAIFGTRTIATGTYDSTSNTSRLELTRTRRAQTPDYSYRVGVQRRPGLSEAFGQASYFHPRFEADARVIGDLENDGPARGRTAAFRLQTGIGFADGSFALGRDTGRGFYLVRRHESLGDADLTLFQGRSRTLPLASSGGLGPAVAPVTTAYQPTELTVDVNGAPTGYDVGDTRFVVLPGARSGVVVEVGSEAYRWRLATLFADGEPVELAYGELINLATDERQSFFTNATGRASFASLAPGDYEIRLSERAFRARFTVLDTDAPFTEMGVINLERIP